ncbi:MAG TPA: 3-deoxy-8-phosphooctulonate synthase [Phycisphaerae bacterium]|nr:3-deoxy-8-phosphooctulonate synthase [Phycisphaerae bacterium]
MDPAGVDVGGVTIGGGGLCVIAGPCVIESRDHCLALGEHAAKVCDRLGLGYIFKASFDKGNRSRMASRRGPGLDEGLEILAAVKRTLGVPVTSDIHESDQAEGAAAVLDLLQIPAFLCRQTDLLLAAGRTRRPVNVKKGQFLSPEEMVGPVEKVRSTGNDNLVLTERGTFFGYHRLVNDMTAIPRMRALAPVVFDATHSCQLPGAAGDRSGGQRQFVPALARAAVAAGADALFLEIHDDPPRAFSDADTVWPLDRLESLLTDCLRIAQVRGSLAP